MKKNSKKQEKVELESELMRLNELVRERRSDLARIQECPNETCKCRLLWNEQVDKTLASQVRKIRKQIVVDKTNSSKPTKSAKSVKRKKSA
jgi:hypothetical protein